MARRLARRRDGGGPGLRGGHHDHDEGIRGARAVAACIHPSRTGCGEDEIRGHVERTFGYRLDPRITAIVAAFRGRLARGG